MSDVRQRMVALEGVGDVLMRRVLRRTMAPKKVRKKGEEIGARAAASEPGQALLKKGGILTLPTRVASKVKVRMMDLMQKFKRKP